MSDIIIPNPSPSFLDKFKSVISEIAEEIKEATVETVEDIKETFEEIAEEIKPLVGKKIYSKEVTKAPEGKIEVAETPEGE